MCTLAELPASILTAAVLSTTPMAVRRYSLGIVTQVVIGGFSAALLVGCGAGNPTGPTRYGPPYVSVSCNAVGTSPLLCTAHVECSLYPCSPGTPSDVTHQAVWEAADPNIVRIAGPGAVEAVAPGDTVIRARWEYVEGQHTVSVFAGLPPLPTHEIFGSVYETGKTVAQAPIAGATVQVVVGLLTGRTATSGVPPPLPPGLFGPFGGPAYYRILAVPPGTYQLRVTKDGFVPQERAVTVSTGSPSANFELHPL